MTKEQQSFLRRKIMTKKILLILLITIFVFTAGAVQAERQLTGDELDFLQTEAGRVFSAAGNVELIYDEIRVTARLEGIYRRYNGEIEFRDNVEIFYNDYTARADELTGNIEEEFYKLKGNAAIEGAESHIEADLIELYQSEQRVEAEGSVYLKYQDFWAEADQAVFYLEREFVELRGNVKGERNGEKFSSDSAEINQKTEEIILKGQAKLSLPAEEDQDDN
jgi:lipopolysaccharide export system protein LptA